MSDSVPHRGAGGPTAAARAPGRADGAQSASPASGGDQAPRADLPPDLAAARLRRDQPGLARLMLGGQVLLEIRPGQLDEVGFAAMIDHLAAALQPRPPARAVVVYREGLLAEAHAEVPMDLLFVEEDPHDTPPVQVRRRQVAADPSRVAAISAEAESRARIPPGG